MRIVKRLVSVLLAAVAVFLLTWRVSKRPDFQFFGELLWRVETEKKQVALTFDDGPSPANTPELLDLLREEGVNATFFLIGENIEKEPALTRRVIADGHQAANHSYSHQRMLWQSREFCRKEIETTDRLIREAGFEGEIVFRPPFGKKLFSLPLALRDLGKLSVTWDVDSLDTQTQEAAVLQDRVLRQVRPGSILLFHDGFSRKEGTLTAVRRVIRELKAKGYEFVTVNKLKADALRESARRG